MKYEKIGQPVRRREDVRLLTGQGSFSDDWAIDGQAYMAVVRSIHAHAILQRVDTSDAAAMRSLTSLMDPHRAPEMVCTWNSGSASVSVLASRAMRGSDA